MCINSKMLNCSKWFIVKYILFLLWILSLLLVFCKSYKFYDDEPEFYVLRKMLGNGLCISRGTAPIIYFLIAVTILPMCRTLNKILHRILRRISIFLLTLYLEKVKVIHMMFSIALVLTSAIHGVAHITNAINFVKYYDWQHEDINWARGTDDSVLRLIFATPTGFSGCLMLTALILMWISSTRSIRHYFYNCFLASHHLFLIVVLVLMYFHPLSNVIKFQIFTGLNCSHNTTTSDDDCHNRELFISGTKRGWIWPTVAISIYLADAFIRLINRNSNVAIMKEIKKLPGRAIFLRLALHKRCLNIRPGQYILLQCLNISSLEWHPFTVTKMPAKFDETFTLVIASRGDWTAELYGKVSANLCFQKNQVICGTHHIRPKLKFFVDGPFPSPLESLFQQKIALCIAGGVGVTPFIAMFNELLLKSVEKPTRIHLVWVIKHMEQALWFSGVFEKLLEKFWEANSPDRLDIQLYVTKNFNSQKIEKFFGQKSSFLKSRIHSGRPKWHSLFDYWAFLYEKQSVAVFSSGPKGLNQEVQQVCHEKNKIGFNYWFLHEGFH